MSGVVVIDANLLLLLVVGSSHKKYIAMHKRLRDSYTIEDFELLGLIIAQFSDIVLLPHVLAEVSNLVRHIDNPAKGKVQGALKVLIETSVELPIESVFGVRRSEFWQLGLTDSIILHLCSLNVAGVTPTLLTADADLADSANSLGYSVIDYQQEYKNG